MCAYAGRSDSSDSPEGAAQVLRRAQQGVPAVGQPPRPAGAGRQGPAQAGAARHHALRELHPSLVHRQVSYAGACRDNSPS